MFSTILEPSPPKRAEVVILPGAFKSKKEKLFSMLLQLYMKRPENDPVLVGAIREKLGQ